MTPRTRPSPTIWQSARRLRLHIIGPVLLFFSGVMLLLAHQEISRPASDNSWSDFVIGAAFAFAAALPLFIHQTLRGPMMETDRRIGQARESRNRRIGLAFFLVVYPVTIVFFRERLSSWGSPTVYGAFTGFFLGILLGIAGVWFYQHRRGQWPPDFER